MHIYAFGSICRGEIKENSDIDLLAIVDGHDSRFDTNLYSIYSYKRIQEIWEEGNPFSWHLFLEGMPIFLSNGSDFIKELGPPKKYKNRKNDCDKFIAIFEEASASLKNENQSKILDLSTIFLSIRNFATCFSINDTTKPDFSRNSALRLGNLSLPLSFEKYTIFERARILCTRGQGLALDFDEINQAIDSLPTIENWMKSLIKEFK